MASLRTQLTELGTALGIYTDAADAAELAQVSVPGLHDHDWRSVVVPALEAGAQGRRAATQALENGREFRRHVLGGRVPQSVEWTGATRSVWVSDIPSDITVDGVYFVQAKYDGSSNMLNTSPSALFDDLLVQDGVRDRPSWYEEAAPAELQHFYEAVVEHAPVALPARVTELTIDDRAGLKQWMSSRAATPRSESDAYLALCRQASRVTAHRWSTTLDEATPSQRTQMLFRMLRIAGGPYWLLGARGGQPLRLRVSDTRTWRARYELRSFAARPGRSGQPQVDWTAHVRDGETGRELAVRGFCEIRWTHRKLQGNPECKVKLITPLDDVPGYEPMHGERPDPQPQLPFDPPLR